MKTVRRQKRRINIILQIIHFQLKKILLIVLSVVFLVAACQQDRDRNGILSERAMIDVLYDYQLAIALASETSTDEPGSVAEKEMKYTEAVFRKYKLTEDEFDLSFAHYARDPKQMMAITDAVSKRFNEEMEKSAAETRGAGAGRGSDTIVVWNNRRGTLLSANGTNHCEIDIPKQALAKAKNDGKSNLRILFGFQSSWVYREGQKAGGIVMNVTFDNDSTAVQSETIREFGRSQGVGVNVPEGRSVRAVKIHLYQSARWERYPQLLSLSNLSLWAIRTKKPSFGASQPEEKQSTTDVVNPDDTESTPPADMDNNGPVPGGGERVNPKLLP